MSTSARRFGKLSFWYRLFGALLATPVLTFTSTCHRAPARHGAATVPASVGRRPAGTRPRARYRLQLSSSAPNAMPWPMIHPPALGSFPADLPSSQPNGRLQSGPGRAMAGGGSSQQPHTWSLFRPMPLHRPQVATCACPPSCCHLPRRSFLRAGTAATQPKRKASRRSALIAAMAASFRRRQDLPPHLPPRLPPACRWPCRSLTQLPLPPPTLALSPLASHPSFASHRAHAFCPSPLHSMQRPSSSSWQDPSLSAPNGCAQPFPRCKCRCRYRRHIGSALGSCYAASSPPKVMLSHGIEKTVIPRLHPSLRPAPISRLEARRGQEEKRALLLESLAPVHLPSTRLPPCLRATPRTCMRLH